MRVARVFLGLMMLFGSFHVPAAGAQTATEAEAQHRASENKQAYTLSGEKLAKAIEYTRKRTVLGFVETGWGIAVLLLLLTLGIAAWMRRTAEGLSGNKWVQGFAFFLLFMAITAVLELPLDMYGHHLSVEYGQSVQHWGSWFGDQAKSFGLSYIFGGLLVMLLFWVIGKSPTRWWFWFWIPAMVAVLFGVFISPIFIDPLFNKFEPLERSNPALVERLEQVVARGGIAIRPERMFLMKASEKVTGLNAYVTGFGASKRVVVWDTSIAKATPDEISFIFGHEMGHYVLNHIYKGIAFTAVVLLVLFWLGYQGMQWLIARYGEAWGVPEQRSWSAFVVLMLVISVFSFLSEPITNGFSRGQEHAADVFGQEAIHGIVKDPQVVAQQAFQVLGEESLTDPNPSPFVEFWTFSHPSIGSRAAFAAAYDPWAPGAQPKYFKK
ncbi:M48 family metallopeptidase [Granulicella sp. dw_53]|uniref:M48 family metallopeptidase n=1 Tax=Granulicella sp. dw_53 TaxID=2719792 RepID=UPI001BD69DC9|nr:M48 family metallopeptidase [Granulicella sp. dw_53]